MDVRDPAGRSRGAGYVELTGYAGGVHLARDGGPKTRSAAHAMDDGERAERARDDGSLPRLRSSSRRGRVVAGMGRRRRYDVDARRRQAPSQDDRRSA